MVYDVISILDFSREEIMQLFNLTDKIRQILLKKKKIPILSGYTAALAFFEPSTRTRLSFELACKKLGMDTLTIIGESAISLMKGERFSDTVKMLDSYSDLILIRHPADGASRFAAEIAESPVINCGDGAHEHPTQALVDLYTIHKFKGDIDNLTIGILGDVRFARTVVSLLRGLTLFKPRKVYIISPPFLHLRDVYRDELKKRGLNFEEKNSLLDVLPKLDVLYVVRIQKERFPDPSDYEKVKGSYMITHKIIRDYAKEDLIILHPLPRVEELALDIDGTKYAKYFDQARFGIYVRIALISMIFDVQDKISYV